MKKTFLFSVISVLLLGGANAATPWWEQPTICRLSPSTCYTNMGAGYLYDTSDPASWDITSNCWGKKYICTEALTDSDITDPVAMGRTEIADASRINSDFDINVLNGDCFGVRKTSSNGAMASVNGNFVKVWCPGILEDPDEVVETGEITYGEQPTCATLSPNGYVDVLKGKCYGKYYSTSEYFIQCDDHDTPTLIVLNGVDPTNIIETSIKTKSDATTLFNTMYGNARTQHQTYFKN